MASATGLLVQETCEWDEELAAELGVEGKLPEIGDAPGERLAPRVGRALAQAGGVPWFPAVGDGAHARTSAAGCDTPSGPR